MQEDDALGAMAQISAIIFAPSSQCNKRQARAQNFFAPISINLVPKVV